MELEALHLSMWDCDHIGINSHKWATKINNSGLLGPIWQYDNLFLDIEEAFSSQRSS